jgi:hypothetical protein
MGTPALGFPRGFAMLTCGSVSHPVVGMVFKTIERLLRPLIGSTPIRSRQSISTHICHG